MKPGHTHTHTNKRQKSLTDVYVHTKTCEKSESAG